MSRHESKFVTHVVVCGERSTERQKCMVSNQISQQLFRKKVLHRVVDSLSVCCGMSSPSLQQAPGCPVSDNAAARLAHYRFSTLGGVCIKLLASQQLTTATEGDQVMTCSTPKQPGQVLAGPRDRDCISTVVQHEFSNKAIGPVMNPVMNPVIILLLFKQLICNHTSINI